MTTKAEWEQYLQQTQIRRRRDEIGVVGAYWKRWLDLNRSRHPVFVTGNAIEPFVR